MAATVAQIVILLIGIAVGWLATWLAIRNRATAAVQDATVPLREENARLAERAAQTARDLENENRRAATFRQESNKVADQIAAANIEVAGLREREKALNRKIEELAAQLAEQQKTLTTEFENIANRILKANANELTENSQKTLAAILNPLRERIRDFQEKVESTHLQGSAHVAALKEQIRLVVETSANIGNKADGLTQALRGSSQAVGHWGELKLGRILEAAGLTEGQEYITQGRGLGLRDEDGHRQKPDVIVCLPENRVMVIDSKLPLVSYERLVMAKDEIERQLRAKELALAVKTHIDGLADAHYQNNDKLLAHDCILMFVPIEGALAASLNADPELFTYGWTRRVVLVGPATLLMTMKTVEALWMYRRQEQNMDEFARLAGTICDKLGESVSDFNNVGEIMSKAIAAQNEALKRLASGKGNVLSVGRRLIKLGARVKKGIPIIAIDGVALDEDGYEVDAIADLGTGETAKH